VLEVSNERLPNLRHQPSLRRKNLAARAGPLVGRAGKARHCRLGKLSYVKSTRKQKGKVVKESPKAGKRLGSNAKVNLWFGKGPAKHK